MKNRYILGMTVVPAALLAFATAEVRGEINDELQIEQAIELRFGTRNGKTYTLQGSNDLGTWKNIGKRGYGTGRVQRHFLSADDGNQNLQFFRLNVNEGSDEGFAPVNLEGRQLILNAGGLPVTGRFGPEGKADLNASTVSYQFFKTGDDQATLEVETDRGLNRYLLEFTGSEAGAFRLEKYIGDLLDDVDVGTFTILSNHALPPVPGGAGGNQPPLPPVVSLGTAKSDLTGLSFVFNDGGEPLWIQFQDATQGRAVDDDEAEPFLYTIEPVNEAEQILRLNYGEDETAELHLVYTGECSGTYILREIEEGELDDIDMGTFSVSTEPIDFDALDYEDDEHGEHDDDDDEHGEHDDDDDEHGEHDDDDDEHGEHDDDDDEHGEHDDDDDEYGEHDDDDDEYGETHGVGAEGHAPESSSDSEGVVGSLSETDVLGAEDKPEIGSDGDAENDPLEGEHEGEDHDEDYPFGHDDDDEDYPFGHDDDDEDYPFGHDDDDDEEHDGDDDDDDYPFGHDDDDDEYEHDDDDDEEYGHGAKPMAPEGGKPDGNFVDREDDEMDVYPVLALLNGTAASEKLQGFESNDTSTGGAGADLFPLTLGTDLITDFNPAEDMIDVGDFARSEDGSATLVDFVALVASSREVADAAGGVSLVIDVDGPHGDATTTLSGVGIADLSSDNVYFGLNGNSVPPVPFTHIAEVLVTSSNGDVVLFPGHPVSQHPVEGMLISRGTGGN